jgi:hypothetical protein
VATLQTFENASSDVYPGGLATFKVQIESYVNSGQAAPASGVTISITASGASDGGTGTPVAATADGVLQLGDGLYSYDWPVPDDQAPGSYLVTWSGTRLSDSMAVTYQQACLVAASPLSVPLPGVYASVAQYRSWSGDTWTPDRRITIALQRATEDIDMALVSAVYRVDADGMPQDASVASVFMRATCAQCQYVIAHNDDAGVKGEYASTSIAGVSATRAQSMQGRALPSVAPRALEILRVNGVLPAAALISW